MAEFTVQFQKIYKKVRPTVKDATALIFILTFLNYVAEMSALWATTVLTRSLCELH